MKTNEIGRACSTYGRGELHAGLLWRNPRERDNLEYLSVDGRAILRWIIKK